MSSIAEVKHERPALHSFGPLGITTYAAMQVIVSSTNFLLDNQTYNHLLTDDILTSQPRFVEGKLALPDLPGIGVELDNEKVHKYAEQYEREGYLSAYDCQQPDFSSEIGKENSIMWFPNQ